MKRFLSVTCVIAVLALMLCSCSQDKQKQDSNDSTTAKPAKSSTATTTQPQKLEVQSSGISDGKIADEFGKRGTQISNNVPTRSIPLSIISAPSDAKCFAVVMTDPDSKPLCGYEWTHWLATNIAEKDIHANASIELKGSMVQGKNSFGAIGYGGPTPPDKAHSYVITVYALNEELSLLNGYSLDDFNSAVKGHTLDTVTITASYAK